MKKNVIDSSNLRTNKTWQKIVLSKLGNAYSGLSGKNKDDFGYGSPYVTYKSVFQKNKIDVSTLEYVNIKPEEKQNLVKFGDLFFTTSSETADEVAMCSVLLNNVDDCYLNSFCFGFRINDFEILDPFFASFLFRGPYLRKQIKVLAQGSTRYNISKSALLKIEIPVPPINEQIQIAQFLNNWEKEIDLNSRILELFILKRKLLISSLFTSTLITQKLRILNDVVSRVRHSFQPSFDVQYREIGIRSHAKGIFHKEPVTGKSLGNKSVFWVEPDCFVVNIVFAWEQAVAKTTEAEVGMIASHRFPMYKPKEGILDLDYLLYFFKSAKGKNLLELASPGGAGRNKTLGQSEFLKLKIPVPPIEEQKKIVRLLNAADKEIELQKQKIEAIKLQKKGLMQQLLTGKKRIKL